MSATSDASSVGELPFWVIDSSLGPAFRFGQAHSWRSDFRYAIVECCGLD